MFQLFFECSQTPRAFIFALLVLSAWIQRSNTAATGQDVSARGGNRPLHASLSERFELPVQFKDAMKKIAQEKRKSRNPTNSATQNSDIEQDLFLDLPADPPQIHEIHKRVLAEFTDDSPSDSDRYNSEFSFTGNGNQAEIHGRDRDRQNENEIHKKITSILTDVTRRKDQRYDDEFPLTDNGIEGEIHNTINGGHVEDENEIREAPLKEYNRMENGRGDGTRGAGIRRIKTGGRRCNDGNRRGGTSRKKIIHTGRRNKCKDEVISRKKVLVVDKLNPEKFKIIEIPITEDVDDFKLSDETLEALGDKISSPIDTTKIKEIKGDEAQRRLQDSKEANKEMDEYEAENENVPENDYI